MTLLKNLFVIQQKYTLMKKQSNLPHVIKYHQVVASIKLNKQ
jgi:hypothetical protein